MIKNVGHGNKMLLMIILLPLLSCIQTNLDVQNEKQYNKILSHTWGKQILNLVQREVINNGHKFINKISEQVDQVKFEVEYQIKEQTSLIQRTQTHLDEYIKIVSKKKADQEVSLAQLKQYLYTNLNPSLQYQQQQVNNLSSSLKSFEDKLNTAQQNLIEQKLKYIKDMNDFDKHFTEILDIFIIIDDIQSEADPFTLGYNQKKAQITKRMDELAKSKISNSMVLLKSEMSILFNSGFKDKKTVDKIRGDLLTLFDDLFTKRDQSEELHLKDSEKIKDDIKYLFEKKKEVTQQAKVTSVTLNSLEAQNFVMGEQILKTQNLLEETIQQIEQKKMLASNLIDKTNSKMQEILKEKDGIKEIEMIFQNNSFQNFLIKKLQNHNDKLLEENIW